MPRIGRLLGSVALPLLALAMLSLSAQGGVITTYGGTSSATAYVEAGRDSESVSIDGTGDYSATASYQDPDWIGSASASAHATLENGGFSTRISASAGGMSQASKGSSGSLTLDFFVSGASAWDLGIDAAGNYSIELTAEGKSAPLYSLKSTMWPGDFYLGTVSLDLEAGAHTLKLTGSHFGSTAGVISPGHLNVTLVPEPVVVWLMISGLGTFLIAGRRRGRQ